MPVELKVNEEIYEIFHCHFPNKKKYRQAIDKYIAVVRDAIELSISKNGHNCINDTYVLSTKDIIDKGGWCTPKLRTGTWVANHYPLFKNINTGNGYSHKLSVVIFFKSRLNITEIELAPPEALPVAILEEINGKYEPEEIIPLNQWDKLLEESNTHRLFERYFPEFDPKTMEYANFMDYNNHAQLFDAMRVDLKSLESALFWLKSGQCKMDKKKLDLPLPNLALLCK